MLSIFFSSSGFFSSCKLLLLLLFSDLCSASCPLLPVAAAVGRKVEGGKGIKAREEEASDTYGRVDLGSLCRLGIEGVLRLDLLTGGIPGLYIDKCARRGATDDVEALRSQASTPVDHVLLVTLGELARSGASSEAWGRDGRRRVGGREHRRRSDEGEGENERSVEREHLVGRQERGCYK